MPSYLERRDLSSSYDSYTRESELDYVTSSDKRSRPLVEYIEYEEDLSPNTSINPRSSVDTYASDASEEEDLALEREEELEHDHIPPLPSYHHEICEPYARPSTPKDFAQLFPSMDRLSIRHDDFTTDGNMNLRVDTIVPGRRRTAIQLFHLRMYDLAKREFSLRRYCRDSGREVCNSKRKYVTPPSLSRPNLQRSMSSAMKTFAKPQFKRANSSSSTFSSKDKPPATSHSYETNADGAILSSRTNNGDHKKNQPQQPTNGIKLEFSNYARVDVERRGSKGKNNKRYEFEWWGHRYMWKRVVEKHLDGVVSFHLIRDAETTPVAHIVPETRSPTQVEADINAGGWIPPCYMWINDKSIIEAVTDVAE